MALVLHPAYSVIERTARAWADSKTAAAQAAAIVRDLYDAGILSGELRSGLVLKAPEYARTNAIAGEQGQRGLR